MEEYPRLQRNPDILCTVQLLLTEACHGTERHYIRLNDLCLWKPCELLPITSPWQLYKFLPIDFCKGEKEKHEGPDVRPLCMCVFPLLFNFCKTLQRFSKVISIHSTIGAEIKFSNRSGSRACFLGRVSFLKYTSSKSLQPLPSVLIVNQWIFKRNYSGDPPCLWGEINCNKT